MTINQAIRILDPATTAEELATIRILRRSARPREDGRRV